MHADRQLKIAIVYDCFFPNTIGGAERWYRNLAERLGATHEVTYLTRRQWGAEGPQTSFETVPVSPGGALYTSSGRRRIWPPLRFGIGVFLHMLRNGRRYDAVHSASFPFFSLLGAALALRLVRSRARLVVDWHELWAHEYWAAYLGSAGGRIGFAVQDLCTRLPDLSFTFSRLVERRLLALGRRARVVRLTGEYAEDEGRAKHLRSDPLSGPPVVLSAGRQIPEKRVPLVPEAIAAARKHIPELRGVILGDGPEAELTATRVRELGLADVVELRGRVEPEQVMEAIGAASCILHPSEREGYGMVVVEATSVGTPAIVVEGPENAATELIDPGVNGLVAETADPEELGRAVTEAIAGGAELRASTLEWYERHRTELSIEDSLARVEASYAS